LVTNWGRLGVGNWGSNGDGVSGTIYTGGIMLEIYQTLIDRGYLTSQTGTGKVNMFDWVPFDPEGLKLLLDEIMEKEKVEVRFFTRVVAADYQQNPVCVNGLILSNIEGLRYVKAKTFIDCTGDAILAEMCGVPCTAPAKVMPSNLQAILLGPDWTKIPLSPWSQIKDQQKYVDQAIADGFFSQPERHVPGAFPQTIAGISQLNAGHVLGMDALNCRSLSDGMVKGRRLVQEYIRFYQTYCKGFEKLRLLYTAALMGVRTSRWIEGEYCLNYDDYKVLRTFPDQIALNTASVDIHPADTSPEAWDEYHKAFMKWPNKYHGIPYGVLVPKGSQNLWVAGRTVSTDQTMQGTIRGQLCCYMMGQAAGVAAAQSVQTGQTACTLNTKTLVLTLRKQGAILPQEELSEEMTRSI